MRPYPANVQIEWIALGRKPQAGQKASILSLVHRFAAFYPDIKEAMAQVIESQIEDAGKTRGRKPTEDDGYEDVLAVGREPRCKYRGCKMKRMPKRVRCLSHLKMYRENARRWYQRNKAASA